ncbi:hypothetical protein [Streptomyces bohaiensis]|uniref:Large membrane protein n=1 Tax=Streptomyces bohaiensis TaxID=1431344 RepID=A0ABX1CC73_9ACTN|nr:hypothetical protein [Streptomyces bohaiensis]NJQ14812.1 hypothetical protein [Streptomyces bohaiensis]
MTEREAVLDDDGAGRRSRRWLPVLAGAAALTLLAGGAYGVNRIGDGTPAAVSPATPGDTLSEAAVHPAGSVFHEVVGELPPLDPAEAPLYGYGEAVDEESVRELAALLKVAGEPRLVGGGWEVGPELPGEVGARLTVAADGEGAWWVTGPDDLSLSVPAPGPPSADPTEEPSVEPDPGAPADPDGSQSSPAMPEPAGPEPVVPARDLPGDTGAEPGAPDGERIAPGPHDGERGLADAPVPEEFLLPEERMGPPPSAQEALAAVSPLLDRLGLDPAAADTTETAGDRRTVRVAGEVDARPVPGLETRLQVDARGVVVHGSGVLGVPTADDSRHPLIDADEALLALNGGVTQPAADAFVVEVSQVELGLVRRHVAGGPVLVPAWLFHHAAAAPGAEPTAEVAVAPELLTGDFGDAASGTSGTTGGFGGGVEPGLPGEPDADGAVRHEPGYEPDGPPEDLEPGPAPADASATSLTYRAWVGACAEYRAVAVETAESVTVSVEEVDPEPDRICTRQALFEQFTVELDEPLGDRTLRDGQGGGAGTPGR